MVYKRDQKVYKWRKTLIWEHYELNECQTKLINDKKKNEVANKELTKKLVWQDRMWLIILIIYDLYIIITVYGEWILWEKPIMIL